MRRVWITRPGPPEVLQVREEPDPSPANGEVRVRTRACGINFADLSARVGLYPDAPKIPCVIGYEVAGTIDAVGGGDVGDLKVGERVFAMPRFGGYTDTLVVPAGQAIRMPEKMTFEEGAALPVVYLTAHHMMLYTGNLRPGMRVFIHSAAGGVGLAAVELAKLHKCEIFGTASESKHEFLREQGVQHPLPNQGYAAEVAKLAGAAGLDLILDPVGGPSWAESYELLGPAGRLVAFGMSSTQPGKRRNLLRAAAQVLRIKKFSPWRMMDDNKSVSGVNMGHLFGRLDILRPQFEALVHLYEEGHIHPRVDRTFPFAEAPAAHHYLHDRKAKGKVLLVP
jgi:NADPH:quinone reductase-like Zn-dependent oxidoreductase